jgi:hypothetical protein
MAQFPTPLAHVVMLLAWIVLSGAVIYQYLSSEFSQARTSWLLGMAGGWIGYSIVEANALVGLPPLVVNIILVLGGITFLAGNGYALYAHTTYSTATRNA